MEPELYRGHRESEHRGHDGDLYEQDDRKKTFKQLIIVIKGLNCIVVHRVVLLAEDVLEVRTSQDENHLNPHHQYLTRNCLKSQPCATAPGRELETRTNYTVDNNSQPRVPGILVEPCIARWTYS